MDVTAFLQRELKHEINILQLEGSNRINGLVVFLVQIKTSQSHEWYEKINENLKDIRLKRSKADPCIYYNISTNRNGNLR